MTKKEQADRREAAIAQLRALLPPGSTVTTVLRHISRSGMQRRITPCIPVTAGDFAGEVRNLSGLVSDALGWRWHDDGSVIVGGCGMDMGYHLVYSLASGLYPDGFGCIGDGSGYEGTGRRCPANDHSNGDRDYTPHGALFTYKAAARKKGGPLHDVTEPVEHWHRDGGFSLRHRWL